MENLKVYNFDFDSYMSYGMMDIDVFAKDKESAINFLKEEIDRIKTDEDASWIKTVEQAIEDNDFIIEEIDIKQEMMFVNYYQE